jgi:hypothetical protein
MSKESKLYIDGVPYEDFAKAMSGEERADEAGSCRSLNPVYLGECESEERPFGLPQVSISSKAALCATCMKRKSRWVFTLDPQNVGNKSLLPGNGLLMLVGPYSRRRICAFCMTPAMILAVRRLYAS